MYFTGMKDYPHLLEALAITVEAARRERGLTKTALADFADLQECYIRGITKARRNPTVTAIFAVCDALGVTPAEFFRRVSGEMKSLEKRGLR